MKHFEGRNWALIKKAEIIAYNDVSFSQNSNSIDFSSISTLNGKNFEEIPFVLESAGFSDLERESTAGNFWEKKAALNIPKLRSEVSAFLKNYEKRKLVLLLTDMNNESHLLYPVRMLRQRTVPGQATALNVTRVEFSGEHKYEAPIVTNYSTSP